MKKVGERDQELIDLKDENVKLKGELGILKDLNTDLEDELSSKQMNLKRKTDFQRNLEDEFEDLSEQNTLLKEKNIKLDADNQNYEDRLVEKDRELDRLRGELSVMQRMLDKMNNHSAKKEYPRRNSPPRNQYRASPAKRERHRFENDQHTYPDRTGPDHPRMVHPSEEYGQRNLRDHFEGDALRPNQYPEEYERQVNEHNYNLRGQQDHFEGAELRKQPHRRDAKRLHNNFVDQEADQDKIHGRGGGRANKQSSNILTWNQPYDGKSILEHSQKGQQRARVFEQRKEEEGNEQIPTEQRLFAGRPTSQRS
jgi:hypothetical protein